MHKLFKAVAIIVGIVVLGSGIGAAASFSFDFNNLAAGVGMTGGGSYLTNPNGSIQNYMNSVIGAAAVTVTGTGPGAGGAVTDKYWNADGHVVGGTCAGTGSSTLVNSSSSGCAPTLGSTGGSSPTFDTYLKSFSSNGQEAGFQFAFTLPNIVIQSVTFDYQIFPDGTCEKLDVTHCGGSGNPNIPDFTFGTNLNANVLTDYGVTPATGSHGYVSDALGGTSEQAPQKLVTGYTAATLGATSFTFMDWPATIGIDNFVVNYHTNTPVPEPASLLLLGTVSLLVARRIRRNRRVGA